MKTSVTLPGEPAPPKTEPSKEEKEEKRLRVSKLFTKGKAANDPFSAPDEKPPYWKILLWGDTATLKTRTALYFPDPCIIDLERGTVAYRSEFNFKVREIATVDDVLEIIHWLRDNRHNYKTFILDTMSQFHFQMMRKWNSIFMHRLRGRKAHKNEWVDWGPKEWTTCKADAQEVNQAIIDLPMNAVVTAHDKPIYAGGGGGDMMGVKIGDGPDADKKLSRPYSIILQMQRDAAGKHFATVIKDRTAKLGRTLKDEHGGRDYYQAIEKAVGKEGLFRGVEPVEHPTKTTLDKIQALVEELELPEEGIVARLEAYGVTSFADLTRPQAKEILTKLLKAKEARK